MSSTIADLLAYADLDPQTREKIERLVSDGVVGGRTLVWNLRQSARRNQEIGYNDALDDVLSRLGALSKEELVVYGVPEIEVDSLKRYLRRILGLPAERT